MSRSQKNEGSFEKKDEKKKKKGAPPPRKRRAKKVPARYGRAIHKLEKRISKALSFPNVWGEQVDRFQKDLVRAKLLFLARRKVLFG